MFASGTKMLVFNYTLSVCITEAIGISRVFQSPVSRPYRKASAFPECQQFPPVFTSPRRGFRDIFFPFLVFLSFFFLLYFFFFLRFFLGEFCHASELRGIKSRGNGIATTHYLRDSKRLDSRSITYTNGKNGRTLLS